MRRLFAWIAGGAGGLAAYRLLRRRPAPALEAPRDVPEEGPDPRAEQLRAKLAETHEEPEPEPPTETEAGADDDPDERRRRVHETGRAALDEMRDGTA